MKHIYVSPHSDDVALSCGGQILANPRKDDILVLNIFTSERGEVRPGSSAMESKFQDAINADRTAEDRAAWSHAGIEPHYADLPEALLRKRFPFAILPQKPDAVVDELYGVLQSQVRSHAGAAVHCPAGFGNHVDHLACKTAAFRLLDAGLIDRIFLYEDIPYSWLKFIRDRYYRLMLRDMELDQESRSIAFRPGGETLAEYLAGKMVPFPRGKKLFPLVYLSLRAGALRNPQSPESKPYRATLHRFALDDALMARKAALLDRYASQLPMLFGSDPEPLLRHHRAAFAQEVTIEVSRTFAAI